MKYFEIREIREEQKKISEELFCDGWDPKTDAPFVMPLTLITGWYGMNFRYMPELEMRWVYPLVFGLCILFNGHISPGGGFSGGSVLGAALILFAVAFGAEAVGRFFPARVFNAVRITGLMLYAAMFGVYIFQGANGIQSELARYIVLVIDLAVGLVVMSTMYGFYSFYTKGEL